MVQSKKEEISMTYDEALKLVNTMSIKSTNRVFKALWKHLTGSDNYIVNSEIDKKMFIAIHLTDKDKDQIEGILKEIGDAP